MQLLDLSLSAVITGRSTFCSPVIGRTDEVNVTQTIESGKKLFINLHIYQIVFS